MVFCVCIGFSFTNGAIAKAIFLSGGAVFLANLWFAWVVRNVDSMNQIFALHMVRFLLYVVGAFCVIYFLKQDPLICACSLIGAHIVFVLASLGLQNFKVGPAPK